MNPALLQPTAEEFRELVSKHGRLTEQAEGRWRDMRSERFRREYSTPLLEAGTRYSGTLERVAQAVKNQLRRLD